MKKIRQSVVQDILQLLWQTQTATTKHKMYGYRIFVYPFHCRKRELGD